MFDLGKGNSDVLRNIAENNEFSIKQDNKTSTVFDTAYSPLNLTFNDVIDENIVISNFDGKSFNATSKTVDGFMETQILNGQELDISGALITQNTEKKFSVNPGGFNDWKVAYDSKTVFSGSWHDNNYDKDGNFINGFSYSLSQTYNGDKNYNKDFLKGSSSIKENNYSFGGFESPIINKDGYIYSPSQYISLMKTINAKTTEELNGVMENLLVQSLDASDKSSSGVLNVNGQHYYLSIPKDTDLIAKSISMQTLKNINGEKRTDQSSDMSFNYSKEWIITDGTQSLESRYERNNLTVSLNKNTYYYNKWGDQINQSAKGWNVGLRTREAQDITNPVTNEVLDISGIYAGLTSELEGVVASAVALANAVIDRVRTIVNEFLGLFISYTTTTFGKINSEWKAIQRSEITQSYGMNDNEVIDKSVTVTRKVINYEYDNEKGYLKSASSVADTCIYNFELNEYVGEDGKFAVNLTDVLGNVITDENGLWKNNSVVILDSNMKPMVFNKTSGKFEANLTCVVTAKSNTQTQYIIIN
ncbi:MAG: hypothetical protein ACD_79C00960G0001, partial [uncultured bacterium]